MDLSRSALHAGQQPIGGKAGILTVFLGGNAADRTKTDQKSVLAAFHDGLRQDMAEDGKKS